MLATCNARGELEGSVPGFASLARVTVDEMRACEEKLLAPDFDSRSRENEGRRIERVDGGWRILNYSKYREKRDPDKRREQNREAQERFRNNRDISQSKPVISPRQKQSTEAEKESTVSAEEIYSAYPRKVGKKTALLAISKAMSKVNHADLLRLTIDYALARKACEERFTPHAATWFNGERYNDPPESWKNGESHKPKQQWCGPL